MRRRQNWILNIFRILAKYFSVLNEKKIFWMRPANFSVRPSSDILVREEPVFFSVCQAILYLLTLLVSINHTNKFLNVTKIVHYIFWRLVWHTQGIQGNVTRWFIGFNFRRKIQNERKIFYEKKSCNEYIISSLKTVQTVGIYN
jgi:hypothetical protein